MVRQVAPRPAATWKALLALGIASGALLWHLLACTESPMAFSPNGRDLAFVTMEPYDGNSNLLEAGPRAYRLMILSDGKRLRTVEESVDAMLTAPAYSPDGKRLCYLRIPLLNAAGVQRLQDLTETASKARSEIPAFPYQDYMAARAELPTTVPTTAPAPTTEDRTLPPVEVAMGVTIRAREGLEIPGALVVRDAATGAVISNTSLSLPWGTGGRDAPDPLALGYVTTRPQFSSDGTFICFCWADWVCTLDLETSTQRVHALGESGVLSPDGKCIAVSAGPVVGFVQVDGRMASYRRLPNPISRSGLVWMDRDQLAVLTTADDGAPRRELYVVRADATVVNSTTLPIQVAGDHAQTGELAVASDGGHMVVALGPDVFYLDARGRLLHHWHGDVDHGLAQPVFAPDAKSLAMKYLEPSDGLYMRTAAIVFFTPDGKELSRAAIPRIDPTTTRPATATTQAASNTQG